MRFMMLVIPKAYEKASPDFVPPADLVAKMTKYNDSLSKAGVLLSLDGLAPPATAARVKFGGGKPKVVDGPFTESKELVAGFAILKVNSKEEAIELTRKFLQVAGDGECELRQIYEADTCATAAVNS